MGAPLSSATRAMAAAGGLLLFGALLVGAGVTAWTDRPADTPEHGAAVER